MARTGRPKKNISKDKFERLCGLQYTKKEIAAFFDCSEDTIEHFCHREYKDSFLNLKMLFSGKQYLVGRPKIDKNKIDKTKNIVYRFIDETDNIIKYVGITRGDRVSDRMSLHKLCDIWKDLGIWKIEYFECENKSEAEAFESHLIALYGTDKYFNTMKVGWGLNQYLPDIENKWKTYEV